MAAVDFHALGQVIWVSFVAGVGVTVLFSLVVFGTGKAGEAGRAGQSGEAAAYRALATCAMLVFAVAVVYAVYVMFEKN